MGELTLMYQHAGAEYCWVNRWANMDADAEFPTYNHEVDDTRRVLLSDVIAPLTNRMLNDSVQVYIPVINR